MGLQRAVAEAKAPVRECGVKYQVSWEEFQLGLEQMLEARMTVRAFAKKVTTAVFAAVACLSCAGALSGCSQVQGALGIVSNSDPSVSLQSALPAGSTLEDGVLTVGINASKSPYGGTNASGETIGLDVDVAASLADELGCKVKIVDVNADGKTAVANGTVDVALGAVKSGNNKSLSYTSAYINDGASLFCLVKNMPDSVADADLSKEKVLVQDSSSAAYEIQDALGTDSVTSVATMQEAFEALEAETSTYFVADAVVGDYYSRDYSDIVRVDYLSANDVSPMYMVTSSSNKELTAAVSQAVNDMSANGSLGVVAAKWLGNQGATLLPGALDVESLPESFKPKGK